MFFMLDGKHIIDKQVNPSLIRQALRFWLIGLAGFLVDAGILYLYRTVFDVDLFLARGCSLSIAMTVSWYLNRKWTFPSQNNRHAINEWLCYLAVNSAGAVVNYSLFIWLVMSNNNFSKHLLIPLAISSGLAAVVSFVLSKYLVFRNASLVAAKD